jgi:hypothetical protein
LRDAKKRSVRTGPRFASVVENSGSDSQFRVAAALDAANVPYLATEASNLAIIDSEMALPTVAERQQALAGLGCRSRWIGLCGGH